jgi:hypothetical protein
MNRTRGGRGLNPQWISMLASMALLRCGAATAPGGALDYGDAGRGASADGPPFTESSCIPRASGNDTPPASCGYLVPDFSALRPGCQGQCLAVAPKGAPQWILYDNPSEWGLRGGDASDVFIETGGTLFALSSSRTVPVIAGTTGSSHALSNVVVEKTIAYFVGVGLTGSAASAGLYGWPVAASGTMATMIASFPVSGAGANGSVRMRLDSGFAYIGWFSGDIDRVPLSGGPAQAAVRGPWVDFVAGDGNVFFIDPSGILRRADESGGAALLPPGTVVKTGVVFDASAHAVVASTGNALLRVAEDGSGVETLLDHEALGGAISADGPCVYFMQYCVSDSGGAIFAPRVLDTSTGALGWVFEEADYPYVPHAAGSSAAAQDGLWTPDAIYEVIDGI